MGLSVESGTASVGLHQQVPIWFVPIFAMRSLHFTGRKETLHLLRERLTHENNRGRPLVVSGLSGVGKTALVLEYAYRYCSEYQYVLGIQGTSERLRANFAALAPVLGLSMPEEQDQEHLIIGVKDWLQRQDSWLLIFNDVEDPAELRQLLPLDVKGHILLTSRSQIAPARMQMLEVTSMLPEESILFLLRYSQLIEPEVARQNISPTLWDKAEEIVVHLGGLPLALVQAGEYIRRTRCGLAGFIERYPQNRARLLKEWPGTDEEYFNTIATTLLSSFKCIERKEPAAADLLRLCAFLSPNDIPEELIIMGGEALPPALREKVHDLMDFDSVIVEILLHSLIYRDGEKRTLTVHCLVQAVLRDSLTVDEQRAWAERVVCLVNQAFSTIDNGNQVMCELYMPHVLACIVLIAQLELNTASALALLYKIGSYCSGCKQQEKAEKFYELALTICEQVYKPGKSDMVVCLDLVADYYQEQGKHADATDLKKRALLLREQQLGPEHPDYQRFFESYIAFLRSVQKQQRADEILASLLVKQMDRRSVQE